ncbi:MAG: transporter substrate-binding domain-containing protein [Burkholderiaceae bacterium]|nr:transporter substrate-binding domain-containing protein [Burkholderiaceae bacterium]
MRHPLVSCAVLACLAPGAHAVEKVVLFGDDDYAPYAFVENGEFRGMYVELLGKAAELLKPAYDVELRPRPWKRGLADLESGASLGLFPPGLKRERTYIAPYSVVLYRETVVLFCNPEFMSKSRRQFPDDFTGVTVGVNAGFLLSARLIDAAKAGKIVLSEAKGNEPNLKKLAAKRIDCYASDRGAALYTAKKLGADPDFKGTKLVEAVELSGEDTFIGYSIKHNPPYKADFIAKMNAALETIKRNGTAAKIENSYLR